MDWIEGAYSSARDWHLQPSEFWAMSPAEFWWEYDAKYREQQRIARDIRRNEVRAGFTAGEWEDAKEKLKEKQRD